MYSCVCVGGIAYWEHHACWEKINLKGKTKRNFCFVRGRMIRDIFIVFSLLFFLLMLCVMVVRPVVVCLFVGRLVFDIHWDTQKMY